MNRRIHFFSKYLIGFLFIIPALFILAGCDHSPSHPSDQMLSFSPEEQEQEKNLLNEVSTHPEKKSFYELAHFYKEAIDSGRHTDDTIRLHRLAHQNFQKAIQFDPNDIPQQIELANLIFDNPDQDKVEIETLFSQIMKIDPGNVEALEVFKHYYLNRPNMPHVQLQKGLNLYENYFNKKGGSLRVWFVMAKAYMVLGQAEHALSMMHEGLDQAELPKHQTNHYWNNNLTKSAVKEYLGEYYMDHNDMERAQKLLTESVAHLDQEGKRSRNYWGCPYHALGKFYAQVGQLNEKAKVDCKAAEIEPQSQYAQIRAAMACYAVSDYTSSLKYIDRALAIKSSPILTATKGLLLLATKEFAQAKIMLKAALKNDPQDIAAKIGLAHLAVKNKDYKKAIYFLKSANPPEKNVLPKLKSQYDYRKEYSDIIPVLAKLYYLGLGWFYSNQNQHEDALNYYENALQIDSKDILLLLGKGNALFGLKQLDEAEEVFNKVLKLQPDNPYALAELALIRYNLGKDAEAENLFKQAMAQNPDQYTCPYEGLGLIYLKQGKVEKAKNLFQKAIDINPEIEFKKFNGLAKIYIKEKRYQKAEKLLKKSIENYPYDPEARKLLKQIKAIQSEESEGSS